MTAAALLLAAYLHAPYGLVLTVMEEGGVDAVAVVWFESRFCPTAYRREYRGTSWGLFQLWDVEHEQHRDFLLLHISSGAAFLAECKEKAGGDLCVAYSIYNSGSPVRSINKGRIVERKRDAMLRVLWRGMR